MQAKIAADVTEEIAQAYLTNYWNRGISPKTYNSVLPDFAKPRQKKRTYDVASPEKSLVAGVGIEPTASRL